MNLGEYANRDATELARLVREGEVRPAELAGLAIEACEKVNGALNGVIEIYDDAADQPDVPPGSDQLLAGVPYLRKDIGATEQGRLVEMGSRLCEGMVAPRDSFYTVRAKAAGLRYLGRSTTSELGLHGTAETLACGATSNPWDTARVAGGSSGGAAAMVAAGVVPMAHASDGAGSIRIPAACCGLVGLKPSRGRVTGGPAMGHPRLTTELVVSRTVRDTAAALDALAGSEPGEPFDIAEPDVAWISSMQTDPGRLRIAVSALVPDGSPVDPQVADNVWATARMLEGLGHEIVEAAPDYGYERLRETFGDLFAVIATAAVPIIAKRFGRPIDESTLEPVTLRWWERAREIDALTYDAALVTCDRIARRIGVFHTEFDLVLTPVLTSPPPLLGTQGGTQHHLSYDQSLDLLFSFFPFTPAINASGQPAIALPTGQTKDRLPVAVQFSARFGDETTLLRVAAQLEEAMPWRDRQPPVHAAA